jgi:hypothetical protein
VRRGTLWAGPQAETHLEWPACWTRRGRLGPIGPVAVRGSRCCGVARSNLQIEQQGVLGAPWPGCR